MFPPSHPPKSHLQKDESSADEQSEANTSHGLEAADTTGEGED